MSVTPSSSPQRQEEKTQGHRSIERFLSRTLVFGSKLQGTFTLMLFVISVVFKCFELSCVQENHSDNEHKHFTVYRPTLLLENYQPWLDLKVHSKVDASVAEVPQWVQFLSLTELHFNKTDVYSWPRLTVLQVFELVLENFVYPWYRWEEILTGFLFCKNFVVYYRHTWRRC